MEVKIADCPLGAKCEEVKLNSDGEQVLYRCPWYVKVTGKNPQSEEIYDEWSGKGTPDLHDIYADFGGVLIMFALIELSKI